MVRSEPRRRSWPVLVVGWLACAAVPALAAAQPAPPAGGRYSVTALVRAMAPAVVFIGNADAKGTVSSIGSGFVTDP